MAGKLGAWTALLACLALGAASPLSAQVPAEESEMGTPLSLRWAHQRPGLLRYNRVEGLSVGARAAALPDLGGKPISFVATARVALGGLRASGRLDIDRRSLGRATGLSVYSETAAMEGAPETFGPLASVLALLGRDDGDYYERSGLAFRLTSPPGRRLSLRAQVYGEYHRALGLESQVALPRLWDDSWRYRPNTVARTGWEHGLDLHVDRSWGSVPRSAGGEIGAFVRAATGTEDFVQGALRATARVALTGPLMLRVDAGLGASGGNPSVQRLWAVGGPASLRGAEPRRMVGPCSWRGRTELAGRVALGEVLVFSDAGWAGACRDGDLESGGAGPDPVVTVGFGVHLVDGVIQLSFGRALDGGASRFDVRVTGVR